jgi:hypothetical protein
MIYSAFVVIKFSNTAEISSNISLITNSNRDLSCVLLAKLGRIEIYKNENLQKNDLN